MTILIGGRNDGALKNALHQLIENAKSVDLAVSYIQPQGWKIFSDIVRKIEPKKIRIVCTSQMGITHPQAVKKCIEQGVQIKDYSGKLTYHPKMYMVPDGKSSEYLLGSANLSSSALNTSVEVAVRGTDTLGVLTPWFNDLFKNSSVEFTKAKLDQMELNYAARIVASIKLKAVQKAAATSIIADSNLVVLDAVFSEFSFNNAATLNFDQAANNIRSIEHAMKVLTAPSASWSGKQSSELKLLGLAADGKLNNLGKKLAKITDRFKFAEEWLRWLIETPESDLVIISPTKRLANAKRTFENFSKMRSDVRHLFVNESRLVDGKNKSLLQTIELLANVGEPALKLDLPTISELAGQLDSLSESQSDVALEIKSYLDNKGRRTWESGDRHVMTTAWLQLNGQ